MQVFYVVGNLRKLWWKDRGRKKEEKEAYSECLNERVPGEMGDWGSGSLGNSGGQYTLLPELCSPKFVCGSPNLQYADLYLEVRTIRR